VSVHILRGNALALPLDDNTVDLVVTSPPYFGLRSYQDTCPACRELERTGDDPRAAFPNWAEHTRKFHHYDGQIGSEATPAEFVDALIAATAEMVRVVKPSGSIWVNLGDKYANRPAAGNFGQKGNPAVSSSGKGRRVGSRPMGRDGNSIQGIRDKSLIGIPWRYALRCIDDLGLILRAEVIWSKPNGLPESVTDRVRRSHETWFHFTLNPRYYSAVDEIREEYSERVLDRQRYAGRDDVPLSKDRGDRHDGNPARGILGHGHRGLSPLGKLPGSVWTIPTQPLTVPSELGVDHFAAFPMEWPRRIVTGWSPREVCTACGEGRRPLVLTDLGVKERDTPAYGAGNHGTGGSTLGSRGTSARITGYACACPDTTAPADAGVVLDPFGGTGTTALVAHALGRHGISVDMSADYCRLAEWRTSDPKELARAQQREYVPPREQVTGQDAFDFDLDMPTPKTGGLAYSKARGQDCAACGYRMQYASRDTCEKCGAVRLTLDGKPA
jgi:DNA modification methylase